MTLTAAPPTALCRQCGANPATARCRGVLLCGTCWRTPGVRDRILAVGRPAESCVNAPLPPRRVHPLPDSPTTATPGSEEKILILKKRAALGQQLHHPDDVRIYRHRRVLGERSMRRPKAAVAPRILRHAY